MKHKSNHLTLQEKNIKTEFTGKRVTKYSGLSRLTPFILGKLKLGKSFDTLFPTSQLNATKFSTTQIILTIILSSLVGLNRVTKIANFTNDILVQTLLNLKSSMSDQTILNRIKSLGKKGSNLLNELILDKSSSWIEKSNLSSITLDVDSSVIKVCGKQEGAAFGFNSSAKKVRTYHPLIAFIGELKIVYNTWFRTGSAYTANGICEFVSQISEKLPKKLTRVFFRADSGFFSGELFDLLEELDYDYLVKVKLYSNIKKKLIDHMEWKKLITKNGIEICEFNYRGGTWKKDRILKGVRILKGYKKVCFFEEVEYEPVYDYFCYCSNLMLDGYQIHMNYAQRSTSETWIEQVKSQLNGGKTIVGDFDSNDIFWQLSVLAYNISVISRIKWNRFKKEEHNTFRDWFINVPGILVSSGRKLYLKIYKYYNNRERWKEFDDLLLNW